MFYFYGLNAQLFEYVMNKKIESTIPLSLHRVLNPQLK